jgi:thioredoxin 1
MDYIQFQQKITQNNRPLVVDFWAPWCGPCRHTKPILEKLASEYAGEVDFLPVNADDSQEVLKKYKVAGIPTVLAIREGAVIARVTGARDESGYRSMFAAMAEGGEVKVPISSIDRVLRLATGALFLGMGIHIQNWIVVIMGGLVAFLGIYDRCPVWAAITRAFRKNKPV